MINRIRDLAPRSIRHKLILASIACILVPAAFTLIMFNFLTEEAVKRQAISNVEDSLELVNGSVTNLLKGMLKTANYVQVNSELNTYFKMVASGNEESDPYHKFMAANRVLEQLDSLTVVGDKSYVTVLLTNGSYFMNYSVNDFNPMEILNEPWFDQLKELKGLQSYWTEAEPTAFHNDKFDHLYQISVARTLRLANSDIYGYVVVTVMEDQINEIISRPSAVDDAMLVNDSGVVISKRDQNGIGTTISYLDVDSSKASSIIRINGDKFLVAQKRIALADWHLVLMQPYEDAIVNIRSIFNRVFIYQLISFFVFLVLLIALVRAFTKPLVRLGKVTTAVQRGNLKVRSGVRGHDEIGRLGWLFDQMLDRVTEMIAEVSDTQARKRKAELKMLQAQINPHFLFNILNSIRMKVMKRGDLESAQMIGSLSILLRMTISREEDEIFLHEEIDLVSHYVNLMNLRQKEEVNLELDIVPEAFLVKVPRFFLQPIVENALIHGFAQKSGTIGIQVTQEQGYLVLTVQDNGKGMEPIQKESILRKIAIHAPHTNVEDEGKGVFSGIGLQNVVERMRILYGAEFTIKVHSEPEAGTIIEMHIPLERRDMECIT